MGEFLAIVITPSVGLFLTTVLAYGLEDRQRANDHVDTNADVRPGIVSVSGSGYAIKVLDKPLASQPRAGNAPNEI